jgi:lipid A 3-O-deacylase
MWQDVGKSLAATAIVGLLFGPVSGSPAVSADLPPAPPTFAQASGFNLTGFEIRGGVLRSTWGPEIGDWSLNGEVVFPKFYQAQGWVDYLIPRLHVGIVGNLQGGTDYLYAGPTWRVNYNRFFADFFLGGAVHDGQVNGHYFDPTRNKLGCRALYHVGWSAGYQFDEHWSAMATFDHISNGAGTLSDCHENQGISILGLRVGYAF